MELDRPFLKLPFIFDAAVLAGEVERVLPEQWLPHPSGLPGNTAVPLVAINGEPRDGFDGQMAATEVLRNSPYLMQVVSSFGEVVARSRLMRLAPGAEVQEHVDFNYHWYSRVRIHVPIITEPSVRFFCGQEEVHMAAGEAWLFDSWRRHRVINGSPSDRIHLVIDIAGEASFMMNMQELSTLAQYNLPVKMFIINNEWMGMVRQWQELIHGGRYSESYSASLPDFAKLADTFGMVGLVAEKLDELDDVINKMLAAPGPVIVDVRVAKEENCFPMIPSGAAHNEMLLGPEDQAEKPISEEGMVLV